MPSPKIEIVSLSRSRAVYFREVDSIEELSHFLKDYPEVQYPHLLVVETVSDGSYSFFFENQGDRLYALNWLSLSIALVTKE